MKFKLISFLILSCFLFYLYSKQLKIKWPTITNICKLPFSLDLFRSGDLLLFFEHGHSFPWPGHAALIIKLEKYGQVFVWDMPNPLLHAPDLLKPLQMYFKNAQKNKKSKIYVQRLEGPDINLLPHIKYLASCAQFDLISAIRHANLIVEDILHLPGIPMILPNNINSKNYFYCTNAVLSILKKAKIVTDNIYHDDSIFFPSTFLNPKFQFNDFVLPPFHYKPIIELI